MDKNPIYESITRGIRIRVRPEYQDEQSTPDEGYYFWTYTIEIANENCNVITDEPPELADDIWFTPGICPNRRSSGAVIELAVTDGLAPG